MGNESVYTYTFQHQKKPDCPVCGQEQVAVSFPKEWVLQQVVDWLLEKQDVLVPGPFECSFAQRGS